MVPSCKKCAVYINTNDKTNLEIINTIVHEVTHVSNYISYKMGLPINYENEEFQSYLNGWLSEKIIEKLLKIK